jgi:ferrochelatase
MKIAIILFSLGGPDSLEAVQPFLHNLFSDPAFITLPSWLRLPLASSSPSAGQPRRSAFTSRSAEAHPS